MAQTHLMVAQGFAIGAGNSTSSVDMTSRPFISAFGDVSAAATITVEVSGDNTTWYDTGATQVLAGAGEFHISLTTAAPYMRLKSSAAVTLNAWIAGKGS